MKIKVAAVQMVSGPDVDRNLEVADGLLAQAAKQSAKLALRPGWLLPCRLPALGWFLGQRL